jgi:3-oxoadipate enol-lactonase
MPFITVDDITVHYDFSGPRDAPVVMLANSLGTTLHMWDEQVNALVRDRRVLRYDLRGHGLTDTTPGDDPAAATIARLADDAAHLLDALGIVGSVDFVGLSIGGMVAQRIAAAHPERIRAVVICATGNAIGTPETWNPRIETVRAGGPQAVAEATMERWFTAHMRAQRPETIAGFANMVRRTPREGYIAGAMAVRDADLRADDARIRARALVVSGELDSSAPPEVGREMAGAIPGARFAVVHGAAHMMAAEQPVAFNELVLGFLEGS